jgi:hypothetical protein
MSRWLKALPRRKKMVKQFRYTTEVQDSVKVDDVFEKIMKQPVNLTMRDLLGTSIGLTKKLQEATKSHRKQTSSEENEVTQEICRVSFEDSDNMLESYEAEYKEAPKITYKVSGQATPRQFIAMASGGYVGNTETEMLIDTGSELNIMSADIQRD